MKQAKKWGGLLLALILAAAAGYAADAENKPMLSIPAFTETDCVWDENGHLISETARGLNGGPALNSRGFMVSARSTCESKSANTSYVLKAMGFSDRRASSCIRVCFSYRNTIAEVDAFLKELKEITKRYGKI